MDRHMQNLADLGHALVTCQGKVYDLETELSEVQDRFTVYEAIGNRIPTDDHNRETLARTLLSEIRLKKRIRNYKDRIASLQIAMRREIESMVFHDTNGTKALVTLD